MGDATEHASSSGKETSPPDDALSKAQTIVEQDPSLSKRDRNWLSKAGRLLHETAPAIRIDRMAAVTSHPLMTTQLRHAGRQTTRPSTSGAV
ncbi:hypothetical protein SAMN05443245_6326 [Paraburkholderia fungorum]|uniref:Uncharacterized protein n=1 Tax=Paraburkholderia fungorum TaxID=134537 RepID=A0A1H1JG73_9BURK|nr:hypothetical protein SAMN05443245_6326 [Paraburkholderia fungorum]